MIQELNGPLVDEQRVRWFRQAAWLWLVSDETAETMNAFSRRMGWPETPEDEWP